MNPRALLTSCAATTGALLVRLYGALLGCLLIWLAADWMATVLLWFA